MGRCATRPSTKSAESSSRTHNRSSSRLRGRRGRWPPSPSGKWPNTPICAPPRICAMRWGWWKKTLRRTTSSSSRALCFWWRKRGKCWWSHERIDEPVRLPALLHTIDRHLHARDGHAVPGGFLLRPRGEFAASTGARVGQNAARGLLRPGARGRTGKVGSVRRLRVRSQPRQLPGHSSAAGVAAAAVPLFRQEGAVPHPFSGHASATRRTSPGGPQQPARLVEEHAGSGAHHPGARRQCVELPGRRTLGRRVAPIQGRPGLHRHQGRCAGGAGGHRGPARTVADGLDPSAKRGGGDARGRPHPYDWDGGLRPHGIDGAALPRGGSIAPSTRNVAWQAAMPPFLAAFLPLPKLFCLTQSACYARGMGPFGWRCLAATLCFLAALPAADFTTYIGDPSDYRVARTIADASGNTYVAGSRDSGMFVMKLDTAGKIALFATLSGKGTDQPNDLAVDAAGNLYLAGATNSTLLPLRNAMQSTPGPGFVVKFNPDATQILFSTYFPGAIQALAVDAAGNLYVTGSTYSSAFPVTPGLPAGTVTPPGSINATSAAFVTKISAAGDSILYSTRISGHQKNGGAGSSCFLSSRSTLGTAIAVDNAGNAYLAGNTDTADLPTTSGVLLGQGTGAFVAKVNSAGTALVYLTYLGPGYVPAGPNIDAANSVTAIAADVAGNAYVTGSTFDDAFQIGKA